MSDESADTMGSLLNGSSPAIEDPVPEETPPSVAIDIGPAAAADSDELAGKFAALLTAHAAETKKLEGITLWWLKSSRSALNLCCWRKSR